MDNLNTNDAMMKKIEEILEEREITFNAKGQPYNVQHVLTKMTSASETDSNDESDSDKSNKDLLADQHGSTQTFASAFSEDPIGRCCRLVVKLHSSGQHRDDFNNWVKTGNEKNWFKIKGKAIKLPHKDLLHDVPTCWDSTYQMIKRCIEMCPV